MDYRDFLSRTETLVLPYFGGATVDARDRKLRVRGNADPGWWQFRVEGRRAVPERKVDQPDLSELPAVRGHVAGGWLFQGGREMDRFALEPEEEPEPLAPCTGRRWYGGELLLDCVEFEDEAEEQARAALDRGESIASVKGVAPSLRAAYGYAVLAAAAARAEVPVSPREAMRRVHDIAAGGVDVANRIVAELVERRRAWLEEQARREHERNIVEVARRARPGDVRPADRRRRGRDPNEHARRALAGAGARMLRARRLNDQQLEVTFQFMGERIISVVDSWSLNVQDAGICLDGADRQLTLDSLPSAIREAIETGQLCITRRA